MVNDFALNRVVSKHGIVIKLGFFGDQRNQKQ